MEYAIGLVLALVVSVFARSVGLDRDRAFYPTVLIVVALLYVLFAVMGGSMRALLLESMVMALFLCAAVLGFKFNMWLVAAGLAAHGVFVFLHRYILTNPGVPEWWPAFCGAYDVAAAGVLAWLVWSSRVVPRKAPARPFHG